MAIASCSTCSSNSDGSTTAAAPASTRRWRASGLPLSGEAEGTRGWARVDPQVGGGEVDASLFHLGVLGGAVDLHHLLVEVPAVVYVLLRRRISSSARSGLTLVSVANLASVAAKS